MTTPAPYETIDDLRHVYLEDSYVLDIVARPGQVRLALDLVLTPDHEAYRPPEPGEQHCYRRAELVFERVVDLRWRHSGAPPAVDATGEPDLGSIDSLTAAGGRYRLEGDWGSMEIESAAPAVRLTDR